MDAVEQESRPVLDRIIYGSAVKLTRISTSQTQQSRAVTTTVGKLCKRAGVEPIAAGLIAHIRPRGRPRDHRVGAAAAAAAAEEIPPTHASPSALK